MRKTPLLPSPQRGQAGEKPERRRGEAGEKPGRRRGEAGVDGRGGTTENSKNHHKNKYERHFGTTRPSSWPRDAPSWAKGARRWSQDRPKKPEDGPRLALRAQDEPKMPQNCPKKASTRLLGASKMVLSPRRRTIFAELAHLCSSLVFPLLPCPFEA